MDHGGYCPGCRVGGGRIAPSGLAVRVALFALGGVLVLVTFGHLLAEPLYEFHTHVIPRAALLLFLLVIPRGDDRLSVDQWLTRRRARV